MRLINRRSALVIAAAAFAAAAGGPASAQEPTSLTFLYSPFADYAPFMVAKDKGYFDEFGLDVELATKTGSAETFQLLASANAEAGGATWGAGLFNAINDGATLQIAATIARIPTEGKSPSPLMVSTQAWDAGLKTAADLKGKRIGQPGPGGFGEYSIAKALEKGGLTLADVEIVNIGPPDTAAAFANGGLDAGWSIEPFSTQIEQAGIGKRLVEDHVQGTELGFIAFNSDFLKANEDAVVRFLAAYLKASRELDNGGWQDPEIRAIVSKYTGAPPELFDDIAFTVRPASGEIDLASVRDQEAFFRGQGSLTYEGDIDLATVYRTDLLEKANTLLEGN